MRISNYFLQSKKYKNYFDNKIKSGFDFALIKTSSDLVTDNSNVITVF